MLGRAPEEALVLVVGGPPCQQLFWAGRNRGRQVLAGPDSIFFYAIPVIARAITELRPDVYVH
eukprot:8064267-Lingulodinium_polyedra.AAC.1